LFRLSKPLVLTLGQICLPCVFDVDRDRGRVGHIPEPAFVRGDGLRDVEAFLDIRRTHMHVVVLQEEELIGRTDNLLSNLLLANSSSQV